MSESVESNRPAWDAEATHPDEVGKLRQALNQVMDPEIGLSIIQLGLIRNFKIVDEQAVIKMILTTPFCPYGPALIDQTRQKAEEGLGIPAEIELGMEVWDFSMMEEGVDMDWGLY
jgi:metal-sulfur cluster biosynthetic enzyme